MKLRMYDTGAKGTSGRMNMFYWQTNRPFSAMETKKIFMDRHEKIGKEIIYTIVHSAMVSAGYKGKDVMIQEIEPVVKQGSVNSVVPVLLCSGRKIVLRIHPKGVKNGYFWVEKTASSLVKKQGVPTYETLFIDDTQKLVPFDFMIMSRVSGDPIQTYLPLPRDLERKLVNETGRYAALIHNIHPSGFGFFDNEIARTAHSLEGQYVLFKQHILAALEIDLRYLVDHSVISKVQNRNIVRLFAKSESFMMCDQGSLIHNDIADWNELTDGTSVTGIMDWDECFSGDPLMELAAYSLFYGEPRLSWYKEGYRSVSRVEDNEDKFQFFMLRYLISKMHLRTKRSAIDSTAILKQNIVWGKKAMEEIFHYFKI